MPIFMNLDFGDHGSVESIEIASFSFGVVNSTTIGSSSTGAGGGKATFHEFTVTKHSDAASSPLLLIAGDRGELLPAVQILFMQNNSKDPYLTYNLQNVLVSSVHWSSGGDRPSESVSFAFGEMAVSYMNEQTGGITSEKIDTGGLFFYPTS